MLNKIKMKKLSFLVFTLLLHVGIFAQRNGTGMSGDGVNEFIENNAASGRQGSIDVMRGMNANEIERLNNAAEGAENVQESLSSHFGHINNIISTAQAIVDLNNALQTLDEGECQPSFAQDDNALMPTSCDETAGCMNCYERPVQSFTTNRLTLARMWCLYTNTKSFNDKAIAFGNTMSAAVPQSGLGWMNAKKMIDDAYTKFIATYDRKLVEVLGALQNNMKQVATCEQRFGVKDWYQKFGFMYFEMMQMKYKRND